MGNDLDLSVPGTAGSADHRRLREAAREYVQAVRRNHWANGCTYVALALGVALPWLDTSAPGNFLLVQGGVVAVVVVGFLGYTYGCRRMALNWLFAMRDVTGVPLPEGSSNRALHGWARQLATDDDRPRDVE